MITDKRVAINENGASHGRDEVRRPVTPPSVAGDSQERLYEFPYHHLIEFDSLDGTGFSQCRNHAGGYRYAAYLIRLLEVVGALDFSSLIDIGCGDGYFLRNLAERMPNRNLMGVDLSDSAIEWARLFSKRLDNKSHAVNFECRDVVANPLPRQFDIATSIHVLEHIPPETLPGFVRANAALVRPGGQFIAMVPSTRLSVARIKRHYQHFTADSLGALLSPQFRVDSIEHLNNDRVGGAILSKLLTNRLFILNSAFLRDRLFRFYVRHFLRCRKPVGFTLMAVCTRL